MCGRYAAAKDPAALVEEFEIGGPPRERLSPDFNVAPTKPVYIVVERPDADDRPERCLDVARWGLIPSWAKDAAIGSRLINARVETLADKPAFRTAYARRRCIVPADGFYEWYVPTDGGGTKRKQPFYIHPADGSSLAMAGLYERWRDPSLPDDDAGAWRTTCTVITTAASEAVRHIHDRMPMTVARRDWATWLDPAHRVDAADFLHPAEAVVLDAYPVSTAVNSVRNNGPSLVTPLAAAETEALF